MFFFQTFYQVIWFGLVDLFATLCIYNKWIVTYLRMALDYGTSLKRGPDPYA